MFVGFQKEDQQEERVYANSYLTEGDTLPNNECFATAKISASAPRLTSAESTHFPERVKMLEKIKKTAQSFLEQQRQQQKQLENSRQEEKHSKILLRKHTITSNLEMSNEQQPQPLQQRVLPPLQSKYDLFQPAKNEENMEIKNAYKVKIHNQNRPRLPVPHDYQTQPTTHPLRCQKFPTGTIQSHLAKSMRSRRTTFGHSNRIAFLAALGHAERTSSTALYHKNGDHRMTGKFWPETDFCDAKGLTQCGSAFADGRILDVPCIYGRVTGIAEKIPRKDDNPVFDVLAYGVGVRARRVERLLGNSWNNTVEKIHNANGNADFRDVLSSHLLYGCKLSFFSGFEVFSNLG
ncbi:hypothetical protein HK100_011108 [Physocladia obscura]|uniref:Uncharacterized protein n=1 Tax=Physocladia obscura TaxID=109957 RepID=A0AAD5TAC9_9FUNG|nr:hypothetical protein HK100_011108 [Physocladia obscura]